jgi:hypothetical protein
MGNTNVLLDSKAQEIMKDVYHLGGGQGEGVVLVDELPETGDPTLLSKLPSGDIYTYTHKVVHNKLMLGGKYKIVDKIPQWFINNLTKDNTLTDAYYFNDYGTMPALITNYNGTDNDITIQTDDGSVVFSGNKTQDEDTVITGVLSGIETTPTVTIGNEFITDLEGGGFTLESVATIFVLGDKEVNVWKKLTGPYDISVYCYFGSEGYMFNVTLQVDDNTLETYADLANWLIDKGFTSDSDTYKQCFAFSNDGSTIYLSMAYSEGIGGIICYDANINMSEITPTTAFSITYLGQNQGE